MVLSADFETTLGQKIENFAIARGISKSEALRQLAEAGLNVGGDALGTVEKMFNRFSLDIMKRFDEKKSIAESAQRRGR